MQGVSLLQLSLVVSCVSAGRIGVGSFYPVLDDTYSSSTGDDPYIAPDAIEPPVTHLDPPVAIGKGYGEEQAYGGYENGGQRARGEKYGGAAQEENYYSDAGKKGVSGQKSQLGFDESLKSQRRNQNDQGYYGDVSAVKNAHEDSRAYQGGQNFGHRGRNTQAIGNRGGHKKGHRTTGFSNSYHKDETGKKSQFYDSVNDEGDHFDHKAVEDAYNNQGGGAYKGGHLDSAYIGDSRGRTGHYGTGTNLQDTRGSKGDYGSREYYNREADYGQKSAHDAARQGEGYYGTGAKHAATGGQATAGFYGGAGQYGGHGRAYY